MGTATSKRGPTALHHVTGGHPSTVTQVDDGAVSILRDSRPAAVAIGSTSLVLEFDHLMALGAVGPSEVFSW